MIWYWKLLSRIHWLTHQKYTEPLGDHSCGSSVHKVSRKRNSDHWDLWRPSVFWSSKSDPLFFLTPRSDPGEVWSLTLPHFSNQLITDLSQLLDLLVLWHKATYRKWFDTMGRGHHSRKWSSPFALACAPASPLSSAPFSDWPDRPPAPVWPSPVHGRCRHWLWKQQNKVSSSA